MWRRLALVVALLLAPPARAQDAAPPAPALADVDPTAPLAGFPPLADVPLRRFTQHKPVTLAIQVHESMDDREVARLATVYGPWLRALCELFAEDYARPAGLEPRPGGLLVVVLSEPRLHDACRAAGAAEDDGQPHAFVAPALPAVFVLDSTGVAGALGSAHVDEALHAAVHALLQSHASAGARAPLWLEEGLARRLASNSGRTPPTTASLRMPDGAALATMARTLVQPELRSVLLRPTRELLAFATRADLDRRIARHVAGPAAGLAAIGHQASLLLAWMEEGDLKRRADVPKMLSVALRGGAAAEVAAVPGDLAALDAPFERWVRTQLESGEHPVTADDFSLAPLPPRVGELAAGVVALPLDLALPSGDARLEHLRALAEAAAGDVHGALARLDALPAEPAGMAPEALAALREDRRLLAGLLDLRAAWLAGRVGKPLALADGGVTLKPTLLRVEADGLVVKDRKSERTLPHSALALETLVDDWVGSGPARAPAEDEARVLAWLLAGTPASRDRMLGRVRKEASEAGARLLERRAEYETQVAEGRALVALALLTEAAVPGAGADEAARAAWLGWAAVAASAATSAPVLERLPALRALGAQVLGARFDADPLGALQPAGRVTDLGGGRVRAEWAFADAADLRDWDEVEPQPLLRDGRQPLVVLSGPHAPAIANGALELRGEGRLRSRLAFAAPLQIDFDLAFQRTPAERQAAESGAPPPGTEVVHDFFLAFCADAWGSGLRNHWYGSLLGLDKQGAHQGLAQSALPGAFVGQWYHVRLEHDGTLVRSQVDGQPMASLEFPHLRRGLLEIEHRSDRVIALRKLVVEGALDVPGLEPARRAWVDERLDGLLGRPYRPAQK